MFYIDSVLTVSSPYLFEPRESAKKQKESGSNGNAATSDSITKKNVLIVEDEALVAENLREWVEHAGYKVTAVLSTGEEAIQTIANTRVDLVLMDVRLAGELNGIETVHLIHQTFMKIPVIFMSAFAEDVFPDISTISPSLYRYVSKPYEEEEIRNIIRELLG